MLRKPNATPDERALTAAFLLLSFGISVAILAKRNLYDDEIRSIPVVIRSARHILAYSARADIHPPGMYLLTHFAWRLIPSFRWMNLFPTAVLYAGLSVFLLNIVPLFAQTRSRVCLLLLATLHPQLLLWGSTMRWYTWWTGIALIVLTIALQLRIQRPRLSAVRAVLLGILMASLFYLNYITVLFALALAAAMFLRYRGQPRSPFLARVFLTLIIFAALIAPQLHPMFAVHLRHGGAQRSGLADSFARLVQSIAASEAYLPWHPLAILAAIVFVGVCIAGILLLARRWHTEVRQLVGGNGALVAITIFAVLFFLLVGASGLGGRPRNGLLLIPILAPVGACIIGTFRARVQNALLIFLAVWSAFGVAHMLGRYGLTKAMMIDRPEEVVAFVRQTSGSSCSLVLTYDPALQFALSQAGLPHVVTLSPYLRSPAPTMSGCARTNLYTVQSFAGGDSTWADTLNDQLRSAAQLIQGQPKVHAFSFDPDAARKRSLARIPGLGGDLASASRLPDYRYVVTSGPIDPGSVNALRSRLPYFFSDAEAASPAPSR